MTNNLFYQQDLLSTQKLSLEQLELVFKTTKQFKQKLPAGLLKNKIIASCFFEPSTRTRLSFETAAYRLGANVIGFSGEESISTKKGETLADTMRMVDGYADIIVIRHSQEGAAALAAEVAEHPVINAGDGANQHPTQALLDLFTIEESQGKINGLSIALVGDLKYGRTIHSLTELFGLYDIRLYLVSPESLSLPTPICDKLKKRGVRFSFHTSLEEVIPKVDILYMTRLQLERYNHNKQNIIDNPFVLTADLLQKAKSNLKIMHPLPRVKEIATDVDNTPFAHYFAQAKNGVYIREALLSLILNEALP